MNPVRINCMWYVWNCQPGVTDHTQKCSLWMHSPWAAPLITGVNKRQQDVILKVRGTDSSGRPSFPLRPRLSLKETRLATTSMFQSTQKRSAVLTVGRYRTDMKHQLNQETSLRHVNQSWLLYQPSFEVGHTIVSHETLRSCTSRPFCFWDVVKSQVNTCKNAYSATSWYASKSSKLHMDCEYVHVQALPWKTTTYVHDVTQAMIIYIILLYIL